MSQTQTGRAVLLGATGLIGSHVLDLLAQRHEYSEIAVITRRPMTMPAGHCHNRVMSLTELASAASDFAGADVFCCLGTTIRQAGSREAFRQVDHDFVLEAARLTESQGGRRFICVSAVNANPGGKAFYARVKGEMETAVQALDIPMVAFMQPSLLRGEREEFRLGEEVGQVVLAIVRPFTAWTRADWLPIDAVTVARAMVALSLKEEKPGCHRYRFRDMERLASELNEKE